MAGGQAEIAERLLARNALVNAPDSQGHTVLWIALHSLAITTRAQKSAPVDTAAVADVLRRHVGSECAKERALGDLCGCSTATLVDGVRDCEDLGPRDGRLDVHGCDDWIV